MEGPDVVEVLGASVVCLIAQLCAYFGVPGAVQFCQLLGHTGAYVLGSFPLQAILQSSWHAGDLDVFLDSHSPRFVYGIVVLTQFLVQGGYRAITQHRNEQYEYPRFSVTTFLRRNRSPIHGGFTIRRVQIIVDLSTVRREPWPVSLWQNFDISACCCAFDGTRLYKAAWNILPHFFVQKYHDATAVRIQKYVSRGLLYLDDVDPQQNGEEVGEVEEVRGGLQPVHTEQNGSGPEADDNDHPRKFVKR